MTKRDPKCSNPFEATIEANMNGFDLFADLFGAAPGKDARPLWDFLRGLSVPVLRRVWSAGVRELGSSTAAESVSIHSGPSDPVGMCAEMLWNLWCRRRIALRSGRLQYVRAWTSGGSDRWEPVDLISHRESRAALERVFEAAGVAL